jgi:uncharacterized protein (TIGR03086 family)
MNGPADIWQQAADCFESKLEAVSDDQWDTASGCGEWTVRELVDHAIFWQANIGTVLGAATSVEDGWDSIKSGIAGALRDPASLEGTIDAGPMTGMPKHQGMGLATADVLLHAWDLARAIGADDTLPAEAVEAVQMGLARVPEQMLRQPMMFGPAVEVPADASAQDKLLGLAGRRP